MNSISKRKKAFEKPQILSQVTLALEKDFVASVFNDVSEVETLGQEVGGIFDVQKDNQFEHKWGGTN